MSCPNYKFWLFLFALIFLLTCIGAAGYIVYYFLHQKGSNALNNPKDPRYVHGSHHDLSVHDSWTNEGPDTKSHTEWVQSGGIWSKGQKSDGREVIVKVKGEFVPGEEEVPPGELSEGHSPMK